MSVENISNLFALKSHWITEPLQALENRLESLNGHDVSNLTMIEVNIS